MRILLDEDVPIQVLSVLQHVLRDHEVTHIADLGWKSKPDKFVYPDAAQHGYEAVVTNDHTQLEDPHATSAIRRSKIHWVHYVQRVRGLRGLALACGAIIAAMPPVVTALETASRQQLVEIKTLSAHDRDRFRLIDPARHPPPYWS